MDGEDGERFHILRQARELVRGGILRYEAAGDVAENIRKTASVLPKHASTRGQVLLHSIAAQVAAGKTINIVDEDHWKPTEGNATRALMQETQEVPGGG